MLGLSAVGCIVAVAPACVHRVTGVMLNALSVNARALFTAQAVHSWLYMCGAALVAM
jgi:hypothetical protein